MDYCSEPLKCFIATACVASLANSTKHHCCARSSSFADMQVSVATCRAPGASLCRFVDASPSTSQRRVRNKQVAANASAAGQDKQSTRQAAAALLSAVTVLASGTGPSFATDNLATQQVPIAGLFTSDDVNSSYSNFHQLKAKDIDGNEVNFADLQGKDFVTLYQDFNEKDLVLVAFPCNQFLNQEPGSNTEIKNFASGKGFKGLLMDKIDVNGPGASPVYAFLKEASGDTSPISWNFAKFLVRKDGTVFGRYGPKTSATDLTPLIEKLLADEK